MIEKFSKNIINDLSKYNNYTKEQQEQMEYTLRVLSYEFIKGIIIIIIFSYFGYLKEVILTLGVMSITKPFIGGYHEDSQAKCFIATLILTLSIILLSSVNHLSFLSCLILNLMSIFCVYNKAPVINDKMPLTRKELIRKNRVIGITNIVILSVISLIMFKIKWFSQIIVWTSIIQTMFMFNKYRKI